MQIAQRFFFSRGVAADLYRQSIIRTGCYAALSVILGLRVVFDAFNYEPIYTLAFALVLLVLSVGSLILSHSRHLQGLQQVALFALPVVDVLLITGIVLASGGVHSRLAFMYAVPSLASIVVSVPFAIAIGGMIIASFSIAAFGGYYGMLPVIEKTPYIDDQVLVSRILRTILFEIVVLGGCIAYAAYLIRRHRQELDARDEIIYRLVERMRTPLSQQEANAVLEAISVPTAPIVQRRNIGTALLCGMCGNSITFLQPYWGIEPQYRRMYSFGEYRNDIHCNDCHAAHTQCAHCSEWGGAQPFTTQEA